jgi:quercetin dioxygenase-like cupin family protein
MKFLWAGMDPGGPTRIMSGGNIALSADTMDGKLMFHAPQLPQVLPPKSENGFVPPGSWDDCMPPNPGELTWMLVRFPPGGAFERHQTPTADYDSILGGSIELILDDGVHKLESGDCVLIAGIDHAWRAGPEGCTMAVLMLGAVNRE